MLAAQKRQWVAEAGPMASARALKPSARTAAAPGRPREAVQPPGVEASCPAFAPNPSGPLLLWYKRDLRLDDHPGWHAAAASVAGAASSGGVVPVFCFDPARYAHLVLPRGGAEALCLALASLDRSLRQHGSRLLVRVGSWEEQLPQLVVQLGAVGVVAEQEVEAGWHQAVGRVAAALPQGVAVRHWRAPLLASYVDDFRELKAQQPGFNEPLSALAKMPALPEAAAGDNNDSGDSGLGISSSQLRQLAADAYCGSLSPSLRAVAAALPEYGSGTGVAPSSTSSSSFSEEDSSDSSGSNSRLIERLVVSIASSSNSDGSQPASCFSSIVREAGLAAEIAAGEGPVLRALGSYLRHLEAAADGGSSEAEAAAMAEAIAAYDLPATPDGCFPALFGRALALGVVSKRRIYAEAAAILQQQEEQPWPAGFRPLRQLGWLLTSSGGAVPQVRRQKKAVAAAAAAEARDFHEQMAAQREGRSAHGAILHHWRWQGLLTDYLAAPAAEGAVSAADSASRPAILLCHGFGAFSEHYRDNIAALAAAGYNVYAPTLPGYGRAEKPVLPYGPGLWTEFLADFVLQVVRRPVVVVGNSIGGFISASLAADYPGVVQGLVLLNSAGRIVEGYQPPAEPARSSPPPPFVVEGVARILFAFLEGDVVRQLRRMYPVRPERADEWLGREIARAARDPGALSVFRSVFYLQPPHALNYLVAQRFGGPTLVLQGVKDPLYNAPARAADLARACPSARVIKLDAGHCPHDEVPELVNRRILDFIEEQVLPPCSKAAAAAATPAAK